VLEKKAITLILCKVNYISNIAFKVFCFVLAFLCFYQLQKQIGDNEQVVIPSAW